MPAKRKNPNPPKRMAAKAATPEALDDFRRRVQASDSDEQFPPAFVFDTEGDAVVGELLRYSQGFDPVYSRRPYPIAVVRNEDTGEDVSVHIFFPALLSAFATAKPAPGERVAIVYAGKRMNRAGTYEYKSFRVEVEREGAEAVPDFASFMPEEDLPF